MVLVPPLTFIAAVNPVKYRCAVPVFIDCDDSFCMDPVKLRNFCEEEPTAAQIESCAMLLAVLASAYDVPMDAEHIVGHRDLSATACPGDALYARIEEIIGKAIWYCEQ